MSKGLRLASYPWRSPDLPTIIFRPSALLTFIICSQNQTRAFPILARKPDYSQVKRALFPALIWANEPADPSYQSKFFALSNNADYPQNYPFELPPQHVESSQFLYYLLTKQRGAFHRIHYTRLRLTNNKVHQCLSPDGFAESLG